jgi:hypothetical protein
MPFSGEFWSRKFAIELEREEAVNKIQKVDYNYFM